MIPNATFMELVQLHERKWGETQYPGRPSLDALLNGYIVVMWSIDKRFIFTIHQDAREVNNLVFGVVTGKVNDPLNRKLVRTFVNREPINFKIKIVTATLVHQQSADQTVVSLKSQRKLSPLPRDPGKKHGEVLPGRHVRMLPGRNVEILKAPVDFKRPK